MKSMERKKRMESGLIWNVAEPESFYTVDVIGSIPVGPT